MTILWDTDCNAPCCAGRIVADNGRDILIQTDWDWPGIASTFGWSVRDIQRCPSCAELVSADTPGPNHGRYICPNCDLEHTPCDHDGTDGTVDCPDCALSASEFISAAGEYLDSADGASADDPGYFAEGGA